MAPPKVKQPRYNVISLRVSDEEKTKIDAIVTKRGGTVSGVMSEALKMYIEKGGMV
jgi:predicted transcriptional regulator